MLSRFSSPFGAHGGADTISRGVEGERLVLRLRGGRSSSARVVAAREHGATERGTPCEAVDPRDRVPVVGVFLDHARHDRVEVAASFGVERSSDVSTAGAAA